MLKRYITAIILIPIVFLVIWQPYPIVFALIVMHLGLINAWEFASITSLKKKSRLRGWEIYLAVGFGAMAHYGGNIENMAVVSIGIILVLMIVRIVFWSSEGESIFPLLYSVFAFIYCGVLWGHLIALRTTPDLRESGPRLALFLLVTIYLGDTFAYHIGSKFGKRKLAPKLSPKKTWAGLWGQLAGNLAGAIIMSRIVLERPPGIFHLILLAIVLGVLGLFGDLLESAVKRSAGVKDSGRTLPGHGGLLDRTDSLFLSAPALFYYYRFII